jgi:hypothetical protein
MRQGVVVVLERVDPLQHRLQPLDLALGGIAAEPGQPVEHQ